MRLARSACRLDISVHRVKSSRAVMPDKMQQRSVTVFRSGMTGNCGKPRARTSSAPLLERARSDIAQHLRHVGCLHNEHPRRRQMESQDVASATDMPEAVTRAYGCLWTGTPVRPAPPGGVCRNDCDHQPRRLRPIGPGYYLNWLPQPRRFAYALR